MKNRIFRTLTVILTLILILPCVCVFAADSSSYIYDAKGKAVEAPPAAEALFTITGGFAGTVSFKNPQDMIVSDNQIYVADTGNNRIVILDINGKFKTEITEYNDSLGIRQTFNTPSGIFVTNDGELYICDTLNKRIIHFTDEFIYKRTISFVTSDTLTKDFIFKPTKMAVDESGRIFVVSEGFNNGLLEFTKEGEFVQYMGASRTSLTASELFWRTFQTKEQREKSSSNVSTEYSNVEIDDLGFLMVTTSAYEYWQYKKGNIQPLRKLNAKGSDVLQRIGDPSGDIEFPDEKLSRSSYTGPSAFVDAATMPYNNYAALDKKRGRVFVYNNDGELMYNFGGLGDYNGGFTSPVALDYENECFYILDGVKNQINIFRTTGYGKLFTEVSKARSEINYSNEETAWNKILGENSNCRLAMRGLGVAAYRRQDMKTALKYFKEAEDRTNYSKAYVFVRRDWIEDNAILMILLFILVIISVIVAKKIWSRAVGKSPEGSYIRTVDFAGYIAFHPIKGFWELKRENRGSLAAAVTFLVTTCLVKIISALCSGFIFNTNDVDSYNLFADIGIVLGAMSLWCICQWCVTVLMNGEGNIKEIFTATCYALVPYIWLNIIACIMSNLLTLNEGEFHTVLIALSVVYLGFLIVMSVMSTHDYSISKTLLVIVIILVVILLVIFVGMLLIALLQQMAAFTIDVYNEIILRL